uniref:plant UBX domain-containing protein 10-like n=1 Tax=Erigeron canadensis TaxID=72917 RepID=UPI001CB96275|nr:plant UBX domain-containing protein 10-like [Erigeron canadensis]
MSNPLDTLEATCTGLVRRMVRLPRTISRAVDQGLNIMKAEERRTNSHHFQPPNVPFQQNHHQPLYQPFPQHFQPDLGFLAGFEQQYGLVHPFFYSCRFIEVLKMSQNEHKLVFLYLHSPDHPFTPPFCKNTLCSEVVVEFLDANFVSWGGLADRSEGLHLATTFRPASFPFCAIVAPSLDDNLDVLQQMEGPVTSEEIVEALQTTLEEHGLAFGNTRAKEEEKRRADIRLRQEQDAAYSASLQADQEKEKKLEKKQKKPQHIANAKNAKILLRFPNGDRKEQIFSCIEKIEAIYKFIDSLGIPGVGRNYKLVSSFPRKVYGVDHMGITLNDAGFYPEITLYIELD